MKPKKKVFPSPLSLAVMVGLSSTMGCRATEPIVPATSQNHYRPLLEAKEIRHFEPAAPAAPNGHLAVLVHGLFRGSFDLAGLGRRLARAGYEVYVYDYPSTRKDVLTHAADFRRFLIAAAVEHPDLTIDIVTHSMGALLTRAALAHLDADADAAWHDGEAARILTFERFGRLVMIAPPNQGSDVARHVLQVLPGGAKLVKPLPDLSSQSGALAARLPQIYAIPTGVVAARFDIAVKRDYAAYAPAAETTVINIDHSFATRSRRVYRAVEQFLESGSFDESAR